MTGTCCSLSFSAAVFFRFSSFERATRPFFLLVGRLLPPSGLEAYFTYRRGSGRFADFCSLMRAYFTSGLLHIRVYASIYSHFSPRTAVVQVYSGHTNVKCDVLYKLKGQNLQKQIKKILFTNKQVRSLAL